MGIPADIKRPGEGRARSEFATTAFLFWEGKANG